MDKLFSACHYKLIVERTMWLHQGKACKQDQNDSMRQLVWRKMRLTRQYCRKMGVIPTCKMKCRYICQACFVVSAVLFIPDHEIGPQMILPLQEMGITNLYVSLYPACAELDHH